MAAWVRKAEKGRHRLNMWSLNLRALKGVGKRFHNLTYVLEKDLVLLEQMKVGHEHTDW